MFPFFLSFRRRRLAGLLRRDLSGLLEPEAFERSFRNERSRSDRSGLPLALVTFRGACAGGPSFVELAHVLVNRCRATDQIGVLGSGALAALLPDTPLSGARAFSADALRLAGLQGEVDCDHYSYPEDGGPLPPRREFDGERRVRPAQPAERAGSAAPAASPVRMHLAPAGGGDDAVLLPSEGPLVLAGRVPCAEPLQFGELDRLTLWRLPRYRRVVDIVAAGSALTLLAPLLGIVALVIKLTSPGPVLYGQARAGRGGVPFRFYKFRSMFTNADEIKEQLRARQEGLGEGGDVIFKLRRDPRVTPVGRFIRKWSIDELPQLWNVLRGDMTLIGPRPPTLDEVAKYAPWQRHRLSAQVGLICIREVTGRSELSFEEWVRSDLRYLMTRSLSLDLKLMARSIIAVLSCRGAY